MAEKLRIGLIGTGQIAKNHLKRYADIPEAEIVAVCDIREDEARQVAEGLDSKPEVFTDFRKLLDMKDVEAVDVCLHNNLHAPVSVAAMEAGKDVFCEKPLAGSYADAHKMIETRERTGRILHMQSNPLFKDEMLAAERLMKEGHLGDIYYAKSSSYRRRGRPFVDGYGTPAFVQKKNASGGALYDMGVYHILRVLHLLGNPAIRTISGATHQQVAMYEDRRESSGYDVEELGVGFVRLEGDITFFIEEAWAINLGSTDGTKIVGSKGGLSLDDFAFHSTLGDMEMDAKFNLSAARTRWQRCGMVGNEHTNSNAHWVAVLQGRAQLIDTAAMGLNMMLMAEGIYLSQKLGREVTPDEVMEASKPTAMWDL